MASVEDPWRRIFTCSRRRLFEQLLFQIGDFQLELKGCNLGGRTCRVLLRTGLASSITATLWTFAATAALLAITTSVRRRRRATRSRLVPCTWAAWLWAVTRVMPFLVAIVARGHAAARQVSCSVGAGVTPTTLTAHAHFQCTAAISATAATTTDCLLSLRDLQRQCTSTRQ